MEPGSIEAMLLEVMEYVYMKHGTDAELRVGVWDEGGEDGPSYYAVIAVRDPRDASRMETELGESSYGSPDITMAFEDLLQEIHEAQVEGSAQP